MLESSARICGVTLTALVALAGGCRSPGTASNLVDAGPQSLSSSSSQAASSSTPASSHSAGASSLSASSRASSSNAPSSASPPSSSSNTPDAGPTDGCRADPRGFSAMYWGVSRAYGDHSAASSLLANAIHVDALALADPAGASFVPSAAHDALVAEGGCGAIILDVYEVFFHDFDLTAADASVRNQLRTGTDLATMRAWLSTGMQGLTHRVVALYLVDEPYLAPHRVTRAQMEALTTTLAADPELGSLPSYVTFAQRCFDPAFTGPCFLSPSERGVPANLGWAAFDWYYAGTTDAAAASAQVHTTVADTLASLVSLASPTTRILLVPAATTFGLQDNSPLPVDLFLAGALQDYHQLFLDTPRVGGLDYFLFPTVQTPGFLGLDALPLSRSMVAAFHGYLLELAGAAPSRIPVVQYWSGAHHDHAYARYIMAGASTSGYAPEGAAFALLPANASAAGQSPLYSCFLQRAGNLQDGYLSTDGQPCAGTAVHLGNVATAPATGMVQLYQLSARADGDEHAYVISSSSPAANSAWDARYTVDGPLGWVWPFP